MYTTNLPVKLSFEKETLSFEKKSLILPKNLRTFGGRVDEFWGKDII